jgi:hypothetical protein
MFIAGLRGKPLVIRRGKCECRGASKIKCSSGSYIRAYQRNEAGGFFLMSIPLLSVSNYTRMMYTNDRDSAGRYPSNGLVLIRRRRSRRERDCGH